MTRTIKTRVFQCGKCATYLSTERGEGMEPLDPQPTGDFEVLTLGVLWCRSCRPDMMEAQDKLRKGRSQ